MTSRSFAFVLALLVPSALLGGALVSEYVFGLAPCEMCYWQRWPHGVAIVFALLSIALHRTGIAGIFLILAALAMAVSGGIGAYHAGVEYGWWEGVTSCATALPRDGDVLGAIMNAPVIRCDVPQWTLLGISLAGYNFILSMAGALAILVLLALSRSRVRDERPEGSRP